MNTTLTKASHQWASRPDEERFTSLPDMLDFSRSFRERASAKVVSSRKIEARPIEDDHKGLALMTADGVVLPTNWAFGQLAARADAPAAYLRKLPTPLAADCINWGLHKSDVQDVGLLVAQEPFNEPDSLAAATGPNYGRIWNEDILASLIQRFGDGVTSDFKVPGEFGRDVEITKDNTTLFASDRDMFVFLADEKHRIEISDRRNGQPGSLARGFFVWNSEVGSQTFGIGTFLFDYVCCNRIVWGAAEYKEVRIRHTSGAPDRFIEEVTPALISYANSSTNSVVQAIDNAKAARLDDVDAFLAKRFTRSQAVAIQLAHKNDEDRPVETVWDAVTAITAYARGVGHQDARVDLERKAGALLEKAAA